MAEAWDATKIPVSIAMARYQVSENLIDQVQILLRREALLESFNPNDPSIPPPPTLKEAIAGIGTSDNHFRCKHCKGGLFRGSESIICVYCGYGQLQESPPEPIAFKSTLGFGWLLHSLRLDGSVSLLVLLLVGILLLWVVNFIALLIVVLAGVVLESSNLIRIQCELYFRNAWQSSVGSYWISFGWDFYFDAE